MGAHVASIDVIYWLSLGCAIANSRRHCESDYRKRLLHLDLLHCLQRLQLKMQRGWPTEDVGDAVSSGDLDSLMAWFRETEGPRFTETGAPTPWNVNFTVERETVRGGTTVFPLLALVALGEAEFNQGKNTTAGHVAVARELISRGADATLEVTVTVPGVFPLSTRFDRGPIGQWSQWTPTAWPESLTQLHIASQAEGDYAADLVAVFLSAPGVDVNKKTTPATTTSADGFTPSSPGGCQTPLAGALAHPHSNSTFGIVSTLLQAGASLDDISDGDAAEACVQRWEDEWVTGINPPWFGDNRDQWNRPYAANLASVKALLAITRRERFIRARNRNFCKELVRFRSLLARGRANATPATPRAIEWSLDPCTPPEVAWRVFGFWNPGD